MSFAAFKFLDSYGKDDASVFFGREKETAEIYQRCSFGKTLVVYGRSGTGKTSLLQCGLGNAFDEQDWLPVFVRRRSELSSDWLEAVREQVSTPPEAHKGIVHEVRNLYLDHFKPLYFIFDQFEELFIFGDEQEVASFFEKVNDLLESDLQVQLIFVIREEYLAHLSSAEQHVEGLLDNRIRIEHMSVARVKGVLSQMCEAAGIEVGEGFIEELSSRMATSTGTIELSYLQVYLDALRRKYPDTTRFTVEMITSLGNFGDVLDTFLQRQLDALEEPAKGEAVLKAFVSAQGTKRLVDLSELHQLSAELGTLLDEAELQVLVNRFVDGRILRQLGEEQKYELRHDTLAAVIYQRITLAEKELLEAKQFVQNAYSRFRKNGTGLRKEDLDYLAPYAKRLYLKDEQKTFLNNAFEQKERMQKRRLRLTQIGVGVLLILLIGAGYLLYQNYQEKQLQARIDESHRLATLSRSPDLGDPMLAFMLAERAHKIHPGAHSHRALLEAYNRGPSLVQQLPTNHFVQISDTSFLIVDQVNKKQYRINQHPGAFVDTTAFSLADELGLRKIDGASALGFWNFEGINGRTSFLTWEGQRFETGVEGASRSFLTLQHDVYTNMASLDGKIFLVRKDSLSLHRIESTVAVTTLLKQMGDSVICKTDRGLEVFSLSDHSLLPFFEISADSTFKYAYPHFEDSLAVLPFDKGFYVVGLKGSRITLTERHFIDGSFEYLKQSRSNRILFKDEQHLILQFTVPLLNDMPNAENKTYFFDISGKEPKLIADSKERFVSKIGEHCFAIYDDVLKTFSAPLPLNEYQKTRTSSAHRAQPIPRDQLNEYQKTRTASARLSKLPLSLMDGLMDGAFNVADVEYSTRFSKLPPSCMDGAFNLADVEYVGRTNNGLFFFKKAPAQLFTTSLSQLWLVSEEGQIIWRYNLPHDISSAADLLHTSGYANTEAVVLKRKNANEIIVFDKAGVVLMKKSWTKKLLLNQRMQQEILLSAGSEGYLFYEVGATYFFRFPEKSKHPSMGATEVSFEEGAKTEFGPSNQLIYVEQKNKEGMVFQLSDQGSVIPLLAEPFKETEKIHGWVDDSTIAFTRKNPTKPEGRSKDVQLYEISPLNKISLKAELLDIPLHLRFLDNSSILAYALFTEEDPMAQILKELRGIGTSKATALPSIAKLLLIDTNLQIDTLTIHTDGKSTIYLGIEHFNSYLFLSKTDTLLTIDLENKKLIATAIPGLSPNHRTWALHDTTPLFEWGAYNDNPMIEVFKKGNIKDTLYGGYTEMYIGNCKIYKKNQSMAYSYSSSSMVMSGNNGVVNPSVDLLELDSSGIYVREWSLALPEGFKLKYFAKDDIALLESAEKLALAFVEGDRSTTILEMDRIFDPNNPVRIAHKKFILTNHRLLNRYELFPINGDVAIEMVRNQGRLGEVRDFTESEREKYLQN